jgi:hypothetical protein
MKYLFAIWSLTLLFGNLQRSLAQNSNNMKISKPITCKLTSPELQERKATVVAELKTLLLEKENGRHGVKLKFEATEQMLDKLTTFVKTERLCCDFLTFTITIEENFVWMDLTGPEGTREFLEAEVGF